MAHGLNNDLYKRHQSNDRGRAAAFGGLEERHTDGNGAHHQGRRVGDRYGILTEAASFTACRFSFLAGRDHRERGALAETAITATPRTAQFFAPSWLFLGSVVLSVWCNG